MIRQLRIKNFKGWQDTGMIRMAPLTVFFGSNSSGKSSIGHLLLMLKQTIDNPDRKTVLFVGNDNSPLQLGTYRDLVYHRDIENCIEFEYQWDLQNTIAITDIETKKPYIGTNMNFSAVIGMKDQRTCEVERLQYRLLNQLNEVLSVCMRKTNGKKQYIIETEKYELLRSVGRPWDSGLPVRFYGFPENVVAFYKNAEFVQTLNLQHENLFNSLYYLGPLRNKPQRLYSWLGSEPDSVGYSGEYAIHSILAAKNRKLNTRKGKKKLPFEEIIAKQLLRMGLIEEFCLLPIADDKQTYEVKVRANNSKDLVDLPDVGFGVSQVLPVLVQLFYAPPKSIIIMEQPEIHLHPRAQALLADVMIDAINAREDGTRDIQLIIETHSEHFLRRLQRRIAEDVLSTEQIAAYFANTDNKPTSLDELEIDLFGSISNWPKDFFGDDMGDIAAQSLAALQKRTKGYKI